MSLRDFNSTADERPVILNHEPMGNGAGLGAFHTTSPEEREPNATPKIIGAVAVALMVGAAGIYFYTVSGSASHPKAMVADNKLPAPPPAPVAAPVPAADTAPATAPQAIPAATPAPEKSAQDIAPVKTASAKPIRTRAASASDTATVPSSDAASARLAADSTQVTQQPQQQAVVTPSEPVSPQAPASSLAANQQAAPVAATTTTATDMPQAQPAATPAPAQDQQTGATPAPAPQQ